MGNFKLLKKRQGKHDGANENEAIADQGMLRERTFLEKGEDCMPIYLYGRSCNNLWRLLRQPCLQIWNVLAIASW